MIYLVINNIANHGFTNNILYSYTGLSSTIYLYNYILPLFCEIRNPNIINAFFINREMDNHYN